VTPLPEWLRPGFAPDAPAPPRRRGSLRPLRRAVAALEAVLGTLVSDSRDGRRAGLLHDADPRAKLLAGVALIVATTLLHGLVTLVACLALAVGLAAAGRVRTVRIAAVLGASVALTTLLMAPATLDVVTPGAPLLTVARPGGGSLGPFRLPETVAVTGAGLAVAARMVLRTSACVTLALVLAATSRPQDLLAGLRALGVPQAFVIVLTMTERYLAVLLRAAQELHLARLARSIGGIGFRREEAWAAAGIGAVFRRTRTLADAVTLAMIARGFTGEVRLLRPPRWRRPEWLLVAAAALAAAALVAADRGFA
jgi:cobalt/nickel transport system permease protein